MNGGEIIANVLKAQGVRFLFTLCGGHISPIFVAAERLGIRVIDTRHEANAVFAADAVARLGGIPGVAAVTAGPGLTNTITAVKNAHLAQSPLVLLGGGAATILKGRGSLQDIDQLAVMKACVKWCGYIRRVQDIVPVLEQAFRISQEGVPGPVFVECPVDTLYDEELVRDWYGAKSNSVPPKSLQERFLRWYVNRHARRLFAGKEKINIPAEPVRAVCKLHRRRQLVKAENMISLAKKPLLLIGSGAMMIPAQAQALAEAVTRMGIPVYLSGMARGLLGRDHPLQMRHKRREAIKESDLVILAGMPNDFRLDYGNHIGRRKFISINRSKKDLYQNKRPTMPILADPQSFIIDLGKLQGPARTEWLASLKARDAVRDREIDEQAATSVTGGINPLNLFRHLEGKLPPSTILIADGGDFVATAAYTLKPRGPLTWLDPGVFGTLGVGAGFAIGAKLVCPEAEVWIIYGDGSAGYSLMEYDTFVRHKLPVISLIGNDAAWAQIERDQVEILQSSTAVKLAHSDYDLIAKAFGADGRRVENMDVFKEAVQDAQSSAKQGIPFILNAIIAKSDFRKGSISM